MLDSTVIDYIYGILVAESSKPEYGFEDLRGSWGYRNGEDFVEKKLRFIRSVRMLSKNCKVCYYDGSYYVYDGKIYVSVRKELLIAAYRQMLEHLRIVVMLDNREGQNEFLNDIKFYNPLVVRNDVVAFSNGVLDLSNYVFYDFSPRFHVTFMHPYEYDPKAQCRKWLSFLHEVLPDKNSRLILQMFLGLGLIERGTAYNMYEGRERNKVELCLILIGTGSNGKSVIYNTAMGIFGKNRISSADYDELTAGGDEGMRGRVLLKDATFNWSSDSDPRTFGRKRSGVFKKIVSGEPVTVRRIGENVGEQGKLPYLIFNLNELPYPDDQSLGFIRRLQFITFDVTIPADRQNKALSYELVKEYPGIFNWILRGCRELKRRKFVFPSSEGNRRSMLLSQLQSNPVLAWVNAYGLRPDARVKGEQCIYVRTQVLLDSLKRFCEDNDVDMVSTQMFGQTMRRIGRGFYKNRKAGNGGILYQIYGCSENMLKEPFVINDPENDMKVDYITEKGTFIMEDD